MIEIRVAVECYAGYRGEQEPRRLFFGPRAVPVVEILDRWLGPDHRYFKVLGPDGDLYILRHNVSAHGWELIFYTRHGSVYDTGQTGLRDAGQRGVATRDARWRRRLRGRPAGGRSD